MKDMAEASAAVLHNTAAISRSSYIHPSIIALADKDYSGGEGILPAAKPLWGLRAAENRLLDFLSRDRQSAETPVRKAS
ncbi:hypothetical protein AJ87_37985 [Rhizobium yanglingense]|nr:hypothetical protein AJ87_37985 [Rhizobium yanglingense]